MKSLDFDMGVSFQKEVNDVYELLRIIKENPPSDNILLGQERYKYLDAAISMIHGGIQDLKERYQKYEEHTSLPIARLSVTFNNVIETLPSDYELKI